MLLRLSDSMTTFIGWLISIKLSLTVHKGGGNLLKFLVRMPLVRNAADKGFFHLLSANFVISLLGFGSQLLVAKLLTPLELGQIKTIQSYFGVATIIAGFGFNTAVLKLCSEDVTHERKSALLRRNLKYTLVSITLTLLALWIIAYADLFSPDPAVNQWIGIYVLALPGTVIASLLMSYLQALKLIKAMANSQTFLRLAGVVIVVVCTYFLRFDGYVYATIFATTASMLFLFSLVKNDLNDHHQIKDAFSQSFHYAGWSFGGNTLATISNYLDILLLNYLITDRDGLGYYGIATVFIMGLNQVTGTIQSIATPYFSAKANDKAEFVRVLWKYQKLLIMVALSAAVLAVIVVPWFVRAVFGESYSTVGTYFQILAIRYLGWSCYALLGIALWGLGKVKLNFLAASISLIISFGLAWVLIEHRGLIGAAVAQAISSFVMLAIVLVMTIITLRRHYQVP